MNYKSLFILAALLAFWATPHANAQVDVTVQPIDLLFGTFNVGADFTVSESFSVEGIIGYTSRSDGYVNANAEYNYTGIPVTLMGKYYLKPRRGADRFYLSGFLRYVNRITTFTDATGYADFTWTRLGIGFGVGAKFKSENGVVLDLGLGIGRAFLDKITFDLNGNRSQVSWPGIMLLPRLGVGYRFGDDTIPLRATAGTPAWGAFCTVLSQP